MEISSVQSSKYSVNNNCEKISSMRAIAELIAIIFQTVTDSEKNAILQRAQIKLDYLSHSQNAASDTRWKGWGSASMSMGVLVATTICAAYCTESQQKVAMLAIERIPDLSRFIDTRCDARIKLTDNQVQLDLMGMQEQDRILQNQPSNKDHLLQTLQAEIARFRSATHDS